LPYDFWEHLGAIGDNFRMLIVGKKDHLDIWRYYEFLKYHRLELYDPFRNAKLRKVA
jgi:hypothetical protein